MVSYAADIRPLFRSQDVAAMKSYGLDLGAYQDVRAAADAILSRLDDGSMPCDGRWGQASIDKFREWIAGGKQP